MIFKKVTGRLPGSSASLNTKLVAAFVAFGLIPMFALGVYATGHEAQKLKESAGERLSEAALADGEAIDRNLFERYGDVQAFAANPMARGEEGPRQQIVDFLTVNYAIYDLMLITDANGVVLTANGVDGAGQPVDTSMLVGRDVSGEDWFQTMITGDSPTGATYYTDGHQHPLVREVYGDDRVTLPFTAAIRNPAGEIVGVWHNEASFDRIVGDILHERQERFATKGVQGIETQLLRSDGIVLDDEHADEILVTNLVEELQLEGAARAVDGSGDWGYVMETPAPNEEHPDPASQVVGYASTDGALGFPGYGWGVLIRQDASIAAAAATDARNAMLTLGAVLAAVIGVLGFLLARGISGPLRRYADKLRQVAEGDLTVDFDASRRDEVGQMGEALNSALDSIGATLAEVEVSGRALAGSAGGLTQLSQEMSSAAVQNSSQATEVVAASEQISANTTAVAAAMEEMGASVREIASNTTEAARMTSQAVEVSGMTRSRMEKLDTSATDIGNVIGVITSIAEQTNLLALNATIEAARVGEAGKGFAVVANEVKALAQQTSTATEEIQAKIEAIQVDARGAVEAIAEISDLIDRVNEISTTIAGAVEEQSATTSEVTQSIAAVTMGTNSITSNIAAVAASANKTREGATNAEVAAAELNGLAERLRDLLAQFKIGAGLATAPTSAPASGALHPPAAPTAPAPIVTNTGAADDFDDVMVPAGWG